MKLPLPSLRVGLLVLVGLVTVALVAGWARGLAESAVNAQSHLSAARSELLQIRTADPATSGGEPVSLNGAASRLSRGCAEVGSAEDALNRIQSDLGPVAPALSLAGAVPIAGARLQSQTAALEVGRELSGAMSALCGADLSSVLEPGSNPGGSLSAVIVGLGAARPRLSEALTRLRRAQAALDEMPLAELEPALREQAQDAADYLPRLIDTTQDVESLLALVDTSTGPKRYLVVSQNADELRGTGGYIGTAGVLEISQSGIELLDFGSSRRFDTPSSLRAVPPVALRPYLGGAYWNLAAANWTPSFPDAARQLAYFYSLQPDAQPLDGVVAVDQSALALLLEATGPVAIPEYDEVVYADNVRAKLHQYLHESGVVDETARKEFAVLVSQAALEALASSSPEALPDVAAAVRRALDEQHLLIWTSLPEPSSALDQRGWTGALLASSGDELMVLENEVSSSKLSQSIHRDLSYSVSLGSAPAVAHLDLSYTDTDPSEGASTPYRTFVQVYAPAGAALREATGSSSGVTSRAECGRTVFGMEVSVPRGGTAHATLEYQLPPTVLSEGYRLLLQQQPNAPAGSIQVRVEGASEGWTYTGPAATGSQSFVAAADGALAVEAPSPTSAVCAEAPTTVTPIPQPRTLRIPSLGVEAPVVQLGISSDGVMEAPATGDEVGWYRTSARPGQPGNSVLSGHVDWAGKLAVFGGLARLREGDDVIVQGDDGQSFRYRVEWNRSYPTYTTPLPEVLGPDAENEVLTLITCDGSFDRRSGDYLSRRFVRARLIG